MCAKFDWFYSWCFNEEANQLAREDLSAALIRPKPSAGSQDPLQENQQDNGFHRNLKTGE